MAREGNSDSEYVKVEKDSLLACLMCFICKQIVSNPTTITECLHFFCHECIMHKITKENRHHCPQCEKFIGINPMDKIRPDYNKKCLVEAILGQQENLKDVNQREENRKTEVGDIEGCSSILLTHPEVVEGSFSSTAAVGSNLATRAMIKTKKRSMASREKSVMTCDGKSEDSQAGSSKQVKSPEQPNGSGNTNMICDGKSEDYQGGSLKQAKSPEQPNGSGNTNIPNLDLNMTPPESPSPEDPERPIILVFGLSNRAKIARPCRPPK